MRNLRLFLCFWILLDVLAGYAGFSPMPDARAQSIPPGITCVTTARNWLQTSTTALTAGTPGSVVLTPCPSGVDYTSGASYDVYINDANAEASNRLTKNS
jgi:hypothetical protein